MRGYVVIDREIVNEEAYSDFAEQIAKAVAAHEGRFIVRSGESETIEGDWAPRGLVIMEFDSLETARGFIRSAEYVALDELRHRAVESRIVVIEGYDSGCSARPHSDRSRESRPIPRPPTPTGSP